MTRAVITGSGLYHPPNVITNEELVATYNEFVEQHNRVNAAAIEAGEAFALPESDAGFITKASGIKQRYVEEKEGILDINRMKPKIRLRGDDELSHMAEYGVKAGREAKIGRAHV